MISTLQLHNLQEHLKSGPTVDTGGHKVNHTLYTKLKFTENTSLTLLMYALNFNL